MHIGPNHPHPIQIELARKIYSYIQLFRVNDSCVDAIIIAKILSSASPASIVIHFTYLDNLHVLRLQLNLYRTNYFSYPLH